MKMTVVERPVILADGVQNTTFTVCSTDPVVDLNLIMVPFVV